MKNLNKILALAGFALLSQQMFSQGGDKVRFGLKITPAVNWYKPDGKLIESNGSLPKFGGGLALEVRLTKVACFQTGLQIDLDGGKTIYNNGNLSAASSNSVSYYYNAVDEEIVKYDQTLSSNAKYKHYQLNTRQYNTTYITLPLSLKLKTKEIGMLTYFGQIGLNTSVRWKAFANDDVTLINDGTNTLSTKETLSKVNITKDVNLINETVNFGFGTELNFSGTTSLVIGLNYNLGFTNAVKASSDYIWKLQNGPEIATNSNDYTRASLVQQVKSNGVVLTIGVLF